ncbi:hypothetical protein GCM10020358_37230 [Amorphoplanes nipponensis]|uniref:Lipoprotein n=1 Tax=Actinoplanes nipponensis TaxID=135950 RepID=A0A919JN85_9ACTN|nr:hypothetical protein [Actinoplanes nipponensis]GIE53893.1 hypothetical protein Ani05nite_74270 [Actinoplanes nipponensis]
MLKRVALLTSVPLATLALAAGCTSAGGPAQPPVSGSAAVPPATATGTPAAATGTPAGDAGDGAGGSGDAAGGDPGDGGMLAGLGEDADWKKIVKPCPNDGQRVIVQRVVTADVTGDGTYDAVVARSCEAVTSYWPSTVEVFDGTSPSTRPERVGTLLADVGPADEPWLTTLRVNGREVVIEANGVDDSSSKGCADLGFTYRYRFTGGSFKRVAREVGNAGKCLPTG